MTEKHNSSSLTSPYDTSQRKEQLPSLPRHIHLSAFVNRLARRLFPRWWVWELAGALVSLLATICLLGLLIQADQRPLQTWVVGNTHLTLNTVVAVLSTAMRSGLMLIVAGALNQSMWNWFATNNYATERIGRPLRDLEIFGEAAANVWNSLRLLYRTKCR